MRIVVTGATGNVGSALVRNLLATGGHEVVGIARRVPEPRQDGFAGVSWRSVDLTKDAEVASLVAAFDRADAVVHLAWGFQPTHRVDHLEQLGVGGTRRMLDAAAAARVGHVVHMSSLGVYSPNPAKEKVDESYPRRGVRTSPYSRHKVAAEDLLDTYGHAHRDVAITRLRPGIIGQRNAGSALLRYAVPAVVPAPLLRHVPVLPLDRRIVVPMVHVDDVVDAIVRVLDRRSVGAFNLAADPPIGPPEIARVLGARHVHVPAAALRVVVAGSWRLHLQKVDPGWLDLARLAPLLDPGRATRELDWRPRTDAVSVLAEVVAGMADSAADATPILRPRSIARELGRLFGEGPADVRRRP